DRDGKGTGAAGQGAEDEVELFVRPGGWQDKLAAAVAYRQGQHPAGGQRLGPGGVGQGQEPGGGEEESARVLPAWVHAVASPGSFVRADPQKAGNVFLLSIRCV